MSEFRKGHVITYSADGGVWHGACYELTTMMKHYRKGALMVRCPKCDNETRTSSLITAQGEVMLAGTLSANPQPILAQACTACGYIELYAPLQLDQPEIHAAREKIPHSELEQVPATA
jgi:predicted nucleic-acid-binding Zn-ribbon protein